MDGEGNYEAGSLAWIVLVIFLIPIRGYVFLTNLRERERKAGRETHFDQLPRVRALTRNRTHNLFGVRDDAPTN